MTGEDATAYALSELERALAGSPNRLGQEKRGSYRYIPLPLGIFVSQISAVVDYTNPYNYPSWIDVGCGIGTKVLLAQHMGFNAHGIDLNRRYVALARRLTRQNHKIILGNALEHDYSGYDVIYFYKPFKNDYLEEQLEAHLIGTAQPGAIFMANLKNYQLWSEKFKDRVEHLWGGTVYRKLA